MNNTICKVVDSSTNAICQKTCKKLRNLLVKSVWIPVLITVTERRLPTKNQMKKEIMEIYKDNA